MLLQNGPKHDSIILPSGTIYDERRGLIVSKHGINGSLNEQLLQYNNKVFVTERNRYVEDMFKESVFTLFPI